MGADDGATVSVGIGVGVSVRAGSVGVLVKSGVVVREGSGVGVVVIVGACVGISVVVMVGAGVLVEMIVGIGVFVGVGVEVCVGLLVGVELVLSVAEGVGSSGVGVSVGSGPKTSRIVLRFTPPGKVIPRVYIPGVSVAVAARSPTTRPASAGKSVVNRQPSSGFALQLMKSSNPSTSTIPGR